MQHNKAISLHIHTYICLYIRVATGQGKVREIQGQGKVREFDNLSGKFGILWKIREIQEKSGKFMKIYIS